MQGASDGRGLQSRKWPELHDANLVAIALLGSGSVQIDFSTPAGASARLRLEGVTRLRLSEFLEGNIVLSVEVVKISRESIGRVWPSMQELLDTENEGVVSAVFENAVRENLLMFEIAPSYGCTALALCKSAVLRSD